MSRMRVVFPSRKRAWAKYTHMRETSGDTRHEGSALCVPNLYGACVCILLALLSLAEIGDHLLSYVVVKVINAENCGNQCVASNF